MTTNRFHKAAKDNLIEILKETTKRDCNSRDEQGMTPTLYAAFHGNLDALRLLCGRGGNPDKADLFGNTALHLAAAQGHKYIVTFLVNFGANIYSTDVDGRTARELAGINGREDILRYIDGVQGKLEATDKKKAKIMQEKAKKDAKKGVDKFTQRMTKQEQILEKIERKKGGRPSMMESIRSRITGNSVNNVNSSAPERRKTYSDIISGGTMSTKGTLSTVQRKILANKKQMGTLDDDFKISGIEDGRRSVSSIKGIRRDSETMLGGTLDHANFGRRGRIDGIFEAEYIDNVPPPPNSGRLTRSKSQPDFLQEIGKDGEKIQQEPPSIFVRPGIGSIVIRKSISNTFGGFYGQLEQESSIGSAESYGQTRQSTDDELSVSESSEEEEDDNPNGPLERFLTAFGLREYLPKFLEEKIDLDILIKLTESDLKSLNLPVGPHRKLVNAINERKAALENPGEVKDSML